MAMGCKDPHGVAPPWAGASSTGGSGGEAGGLPGRRTGVVAGLGGRGSAAEAAQPHWRPRMTRTDQKVEKGKSFPGGELQNKVASQGTLIRNSAALGSGRNFLLLGEMIVVKNHTLFPQNHLKKAFCDGLRATMPQNWTQKGIAWLLPFL